MYLKQIKVNGFKSFADKLDIDFESGITGIVGPNGSGKSNIVDAVRWVLGEQSVKSLRGEGSMTDVIFSGSKTREASNSASVTLIFDNSDNKLKIDYREVSIKRIVYKNGDNEYFLNGEKCRLKDITDLLIDSGTGRESFNIISQGDIANIISTKPEDRRVIFESAAGVLKYKKRKEEAIKKLEKTHDNIDRVNDIVNELEGQVEPLKEQSEKAKIYLSTKEELESIEVSLIASDIDRLNSEYGETKQSIELINDEILNMSTDINKGDSELENRKIEYDKLSNELQSKQQELLEQTRLVEKLNSEKTIITERKKYEVEDIKLHSNIVNLKEQELLLENNIFNIDKDIDNIKNELDGMNKYKEETRVLLSNNKNDRDKLFNELNNKIKSKTSIEYRINTLESNIENNSELPYAVKSVLNNPRLKGINDVIGKIITFDDIYATAIDIALGLSSQFIVVDDESSAKEAISYLKSNNIGRATFFPISVIEKRTIDDYTYNEIKNIKGYINIASNLVKYDLKYENIILNQLGNIIVVNDIDTANKISNIIKHKYRVVTLDGELLHVGGSISGGTSKKNNSIILDKMELEKNLKEYALLQKDIVVLEPKINNIDITIKDIEEKYSSSIAKQASLEEILATKINIKRDYKNELETIKSNQNSISNMLNNTLSNEEDNILKAYFEALKDKDGVTKDIEILNKKADTYKDEINNIEHNMRLSNSLYNKKQMELKELEIKVTRMDVTLDTLLKTLNEDYNMTFERAKRDYILVMDSNIARRKVNELKKIIRELGMVNIAAIEEYDRVSTRYEFLINQKSDLYKAENTLLDIIREMDIVMKDSFSDTFKLIEYEFKNVFKDLFGGGYAELRLTDPSNILETGIDIIALPPGKKLQHISLLSGGEKALTAIALLFSILKIRPVPFCLLDEVEAPLDEVNVDNFGAFLQRFEKNTQFIVITHKKRTMEYAKVLYGITMQESGVSKLVSVRLDELK